MHETNETTDCAMGVGFQIRRVHFSGQLNPKPFLREAGPCNSYLIHLTSSRQRTRHFHHQPRHYGIALEIKQSSLTDDDEELGYLSPVSTGLYARSWWCDRQSICSASPQSQAIAQDSSPCPAVQLPCGHLKIPFKACALKSFGIGSWP